MSTIVVKRIIIHKVTEYYDVEAKDVLDAIHEMITHPERYENPHSEDTEVLADVLVPL